MATAATASIFQQATALLSQLTPEDISGDNSPEVVALREAGIKLFGRAVLHQRYGEQDVVTFLREQAGHRELLRRLERLQKQINAEHAKQKADSQKAGINKQRQATLEAIEASAADALLLKDDGNAVDASDTIVAVRAENGADPSTAAPPRLPPRAKIIAETAEGEEELSAAARLARGSFRRACGVCKRSYSEVHHFYHKLCPECAEFNYEKRLQSADLTGYVAVVTGGRVRIGYEIVLKLLRAGCHVVCTTRFPADAAQRFANEEDAEVWREKLEICGPLELANVRVVEAFCAALVRKFGRIHILINNAAQTLTRDPGWFHRMDSLEMEASKALPMIAQGFMASDLQTSLLMPSSAAVGSGDGGGAASNGGVATAAAEDDGSKPSELSVAKYMELSEGALVVSSSSGGNSSSGHAGEANGSNGALLQPADLAAFPEGRLDETRQPLDLSTTNSWSRRLGEVPTAELLHTLAANAVAPFILCGALGPALSPTPGSNEPYGHIINVSALEGKFSVGKKGAGHPHTNMSKAALNMLTLTSATSLFQERVLVNAVDTGWVTDMAPGGVGAVAATHATHVGPPLDAVDGAARVLDPIFSHVKEPEKWLVKGKFWKDYAVAHW